jgi:hypothetical protein
VSDIHNWIGRKLVSGDGATPDELMQWAEKTSYSENEVRAALKDMDLLGRDLLWSERFEDGWDGPTWSWTPPVGRVVLYRFYDGNVLLYVGISGRIKNRVKEHANASSWFDLADRVTLARYDTRADARRAEREAIKNEHPKHNVVHAQ